MLKQTPRTINLAFTDNHRITEFSSRPAPAGLCAGANDPVSAGAVIHVTEYHSLIVFSDHQGAVRSAPLFDSQGGGSAKDAPAQVSCHLECAVMLFNPLGREANYVYFA